MRTSNNINTRFKRVGICGPSGTGKTTLANYIANEYSLPFVNSSSKVLWQKYNYKSHRQVYYDIYRNPAKAIALQMSILEFRENTLRGREYFITDRTPIDQAAYYLSYFPLENTFNKQKFIENLSRAMKPFDSIIFIRYKNRKIEDDGQRITDPYYQGMMDSIMDFIIKEDILGIKANILTIDIWDWELRKSMIKNYLL